MTFSKFTDHKSPLFKELSILPLDDINNFFNSQQRYSQKYYKIILKRSFNTGTH